jgi:hypothetical protein
MQAALWTAGVHSQGIALYVDAWTAVLTALAGPLIEEFSDSLLTYLQEQKRSPHIVYSHYADAGAIGRLVRLRDQLRTFGLCHYMRRWRLFSASRKFMWGTR